MKKLLLVMVFLLYSHYGFSQKLKTYYINYKGDKTSQANANYKRTVQKQNDIWVVKDYYFNDSLKRTGTFTDKQLRKRTGTFTSYYMNGKVDQSVNYENDLKHGVQKKYFITGTISQLSEYSKGEISGKWTWYHEDGSIANEMDNMNANTLSDYQAPAKFPGGNKKLSEYIKKVDYQLREGNKVYNGRTITSFQINADGNVSDIDIIMQGTQQMDSAIIKHLKNMPKWTPYKKAGNYVSSNYILPIAFGQQNKALLSNIDIGNAFYNSSVEDYKNEQYEKVIFKLLRALNYSHMEANYYFLLGHSYYQQEITMRCHQESLYIVRTHNSYV